MAKIFMTGGSGDLGRVLAPLLVERGDEPVSFDIRRSPSDAARYIPGSILDLNALAGAMAGCDAVIHIAAWHGIHLARGEKDVFDFWELNVTGTFYVLETAVRHGINQFIFISSTSVSAWPDVYGSSKLLAEEVVRTYTARHGLNAITLRPRAFIPHWNRTTYKDYIEWANWFWGGAVHIDDVAQAVLQSLDLISTSTLQKPLTLTLDGAYEYTAADLAQWDAEGPGSTFARVYPGYSELVKRYGLDPARKPRPLDISETRRRLGYEPQFSLQSLLDELAEYGSEGPPPPGL